MPEELKKPELPVNYQRLEGSERHPSPGARLLGPAEPNETFTVTIVLRRRLDGPPIPDIHSITEFPPSQRRRLSADEFTARYGASSQDIDRVMEFAKAHGLIVVETNATRRTVVVSGTVAQMSETFAVSLGRFEHEITPRRGQKPQSEIYRGRDGFIHVPSELSEIIVGVFGLDNRTLTKRNSADPPNTTTLSVQQVAQLYNFPTNSAAGQTIGILSPGGGYSGYYQQDLQAYFGTSLPTVTPISVYGVSNGSVKPVTTAKTAKGSAVLTFASTTGILYQSNLYSPALSVPDPNNLWVLSVTSTTVTLNQAVSADVPAGTQFYFNWDGETTQDICIAAAAAPGANVAVYFSDGDQQGWVNLIHRAVHPDPGDPVCSVLSCSFYITNGDDATTLTNEGASDAMVKAISAAFLDAALQDVTVCIASGDTGSNSKAGKYPIPGTYPVAYGGDGKAHVQYPGSDPWVLSVGGTTIGHIVKTPPSFDEYVWNDPDPSDPAQWGTTGGGVSYHFDLPAYQSNAGVPKSVNDNTRVGRGVPDVAGNASYNSGYSGLFLAGTALIGNGTSASAPHWAGLIAVINAALGENVGFINPLIYQLGSSVFRDINPPPGPSDNSNSGIAGYPAGPGWDACTGWGSPDGAALLAGLQQFFVKECVFITDRNTFGKDEIDAMLHLGSPATIPAAFYIEVDGLRPNDLGITPSDLSGIPSINPTITPQSPVSGMSIGDSLGRASALIPQDSTLPPSPQRFTWVFPISFTSTAGFVPGGQTITLTASINSVSGSADIQLNEVANIYEVDGSISWLSADTRVFMVKEGESWFNSPAKGATTSDTSSFIKAIINNLNGGAAGVQTFDSLPASEDGSTLALYQFDHNNKAVFNFALSRVRYRSLNPPDPTGVRVFFRLCPALSVSVDYNPTTTYKRSPVLNPDGQPIPVLGVESGNIVTIPFFAEGRKDTTIDSMDQQTDPVNVQTIPHDASGNEVERYFGCWLDTNQPTDLRFPLNPSGDGPYSGTLKSVFDLVRNAHQCLLTEIAFDPEPIIGNPSPAMSDKLAQRNISLVLSDNPGNGLSRRIPNTFELKPTPLKLAAGEQPDELLIDWGNTPAGSTAQIFIPAVQASQILEMASRMYSMHHLIKNDDHTIQCPASGITYVPIPPGSDLNYAGLLTVDLPSGVRRGQLIRIVMHQVTNAVGPRNGVPQSGEAINVSAPETVVVTDGRQVRWRRIRGSVQISIPISSRELILESEEQLLSMFRWVEKSIPANDRWYPVYRRYVEQVAQRVQGFGGDPGQIKPSPNGDGYSGGGRGWLRGWCHRIAWLVIAALAFWISLVGLVLSPPASWLLPVVTVVWVSVFVIWEWRCNPDLCTHIWVLLLGAAGGAGLLGLGILSGLSGPTTNLVLAASGVAVFLLALVAFVRGCSPFFLDRRRH